MATTMKAGLLKGLRYITQIFDDDKEPEMQIGFPTDVKHVAHIGWDGPVANSPSWLDNFKLDQDTMSGHLGTNDSSLRGNLHGTSPARYFPDLPKSSRRFDANSRKGHSGSEVSAGSESPSRNLLEIPKKTRRKKSKDSSSQGGSSKSTSRTAKAIAEASTYTSSPFSDSALGSIPHLRNNDLYSCPSPNSHPFS